MTKRPEIRSAQRIGIIGKNGSGKTTLLGQIYGEYDPHRIGYVPQIIDEHYCLSGGQRFNKALSAALASEPELLLLDEPTNHLDMKNRRALLSMLQRFRGTLIVASHDPGLLRSCVDVLWHVEPEQITVFNGKYDDYQKQVADRRCGLERKLLILQTEKRRSHDELMREQERAKKKKAYGEKKYDGDKIALRGAQGSGERTVNKNRKRLGGEKEEVETQLKALRLPEVIKPKFSLSAAMLSERKPVVMVSDGSCGYDAAVLTGLHFRLSVSERLVVCGENGSGKTTLVKAILGDTSVWRTGVWKVPEAGDVGYLDQNYATLDPERCALEIIQASAPSWTIAEIRDHLNAFLFRKNPEVYRKAKELSGGERARLSLAQIAATTPKLLILDEVTNNLDSETRTHVIDVLREYPGAMIVISHDEEFARSLGECVLTSTSFLPIGMT